MSLPNRESVFYLPLSNEQRLLNAIRDGQTLETIREIVDGGLDINNCPRGFGEMDSFLSVAIGIDTSIRSEEDRLALVRYLLQQPGISFDEGHNIDLLSEAVAQRDLRLVNLLLGQPGMPPVSDRSLEAATRGNLLKIVLALVNAGANIEPFFEGDEFEGQSTLRSWIQSRLGEEPDNIDLLAIQNATGTQARNNATLLQAVISGDYFLVTRILSAKNACIETRDGTGLTPFLLAARDGNVLMMHLLLKNGADLYAVNKNRSSALHLAVNACSESAVKFLSQHAHALFSKGNVSLLGLSPMDLAMRHGRRLDMTPIIRTLLQYGENPAGIEYARDAEFFQCWAVANSDIPLEVIQEQSELFRAPVIVLNHQVDAPAAYRIYYFNTHAQFFSQDFEPSSVLAEHLTGLRPENGMRLVAGRLAKEMYEALDIPRAPINPMLDEMFKQIESGYRLLDDLYSLETQASFVTQIASADPNVRADDLSTLLMRANAPQVVGELLNAGADINAQDSDGKTALHYALAAQSYGKLLAILMRTNADATICSKSGQAALDIALQMLEENTHNIHLVEIVQLMIQRCADHAKSLDTWQARIRTLVQQHAPEEGAESTELQAAYRDLGRTLEQAPAQARRRVAQENEFSWFARGALGFLVAVTSPLWGPILLIDLAVEAVAAVVFGRSNDNLSNLFIPGVLAAFQATVGRAIRITWDGVDPARASLAAFNPHQQTPLTRYNVSGTAGGSSEPRFTPGYNNGVRSGSPMAPDQDPDVRLRSPSARPGSRAEKDA